MKAPATLDEFYEMFPTEHRCWAYLRRIRWPEGFRCPRWEARKAHRLRVRGLWQCARCRYQVSLTAGTPLHGTRLPLRTWFLAMFFVARHKKGISALQLQRDTGLGSYKTAWTLLHKVRSTLGRNPDFRLTGEVEADESYMGRRRTRARLSRGARMTPVGILVENRGDHAGRVHLEVLPGVGPRSSCASFGAGSMSAMPRCGPTVFRVTPGLENSESDTGGESSGVRAVLQSFCPGSMPWLRM